MKMVQLEAFGVPSEVCRCVEVEDVGSPGEGEVVVDIEAAPINPADLLTIEGTYPGPTELPAPMGIEGTGRVSAVGDGVNSLAVGDRVISLSRANWAQRVKLPAGQAIKVSGDADTLQVAMLKVNPATALSMLRDFVDLAPGDWVIQNAANSGVGHHVIRLAREQGLHSVNLVRRASLIDELKAVGGDVVLVDGEDIAEQVKAETKGGAVKLGIDAIGGSATRRIADCLADDGVVVNYGFLSGEPCMITPHQAIVHGITLKGFWLVKTLRAMSPGEVQALYQELAEKTADGTLHVPVEATYPLEAIGEALAHAGRAGRGGKILLTPNGPIG